MRKNRIAQLGIRQLCNHCNLDGGHNFPCVNAEGGKPEDPISRGLNQRFQESSCLRKRVRAEHLFHGNLEQSVCDAPILSLFLAEAYARKLWEKQAQNRSEEHTSELQSRLHLVCR